MADIDRSRRISADPQSVWDVLADFGSISSWADNIDHSCILIQGCEPIGTTRRVQIGRNALIDHVSRNKGEVALPDGVDEIGVTEAAPGLSPERQAQNSQEAALLKRALRAMPQEKREVLIMSRFLELKYEEIATVLNCEVGTVKVRVHRALRELGDRFFALRGERAS